MKITSIRWLSFLLSVLILALLLLSSMLYSRQVDGPSETLIVRQVELASPPPAPPPPPVNQSHQVESAPDFDLAVDGSGPTLEFESVNLQADLNIQPIETDLAQDWKPIMEDNLNINWQAFGLGELDETPKLLTALKISYPKSLSRKGINHVEIELDVLIDEAGTVVLRRVLHNQHPEMETVIRALIHKARFTSPKKDGIAVRAAFNWPLEFANS